MTLNLLPVEPTFSVAEPPPQPADPRLALLVEIGKRAEMALPPGEHIQALDVLDEVTAMFMADTAVMQRAYARNVAALALRLIEQIDRLETPR